jgi:hypothetical protein
MATSGSTPDSSFGAASMHAALTFFAGCGLRQLIVCERFAWQHQMWWLHCMACCGNSHRSECLG